MLGIHPGWGGTARLPRLIGATRGAAGDAHRPRPFRAQARSTWAWSTGLRQGRTAGRSAPAAASSAHATDWSARSNAWATNTWLVRQVLAPMMVRQTAAKVRKEHYPAPFALIDVWRRGGSNIAQRLRLEARSVARLAQTSTAQNLIRIFFLQERLKSPGRRHPSTDIEHVHVVGAGVMGGDIAAWAR